jgi:hypothetical protein
MLLSVAASAQESLCSPCVDVPVNIPLDDIQRINSRVPVTHGDVPGFGIMTAPAPTRVLVPTSQSAVMRLRLGNSAPVRMPVSLGDPGSYPTLFASVFNAAADYLRSRDYDPATFFARLLLCPDQICTLDIYPAVLAYANVQVVRACPAGYCATMTYSLPENRVLEIREWRRQE